MTQDSIAASRRSQLFIAVSLLFFLTACASPCLEVSQKNDPVWYGFRILVIGWLGLLVGQFAWLANPLWLAGLVFFAFRKRGATLIFSGLALLFAANTLLLFGMELPADEGGVNKFHLVRLRFGFFLWLASLLTLFAGVFVMRHQSRKPQS